MFKSADIFNRADLEYRSLETESSYAQMLQGVEQAGHRRRIRLTLIVNFISMLVSIGLFVVSILLLIKYQRLTFILSVLVNGFTVILLIISLIWAFRTNKGLSYAREPGYALSYFVCIGTYASTVFMLVQTAWYLIYKPYHYSYLIGLKVVVDPASKSTFTFERAWNIDSIMFAVILACSFYLGMQLFWFGHVIRKFKSIRYFFTRVVLYMATVGCIGACWMIIYWSNQVLSFREELPKRMGKHLPEMLRVFGWAGVVVCLINTLSNFHRRKHIYTVVAILSGLIFMGLTMTSLMLIKDVRSASYTEPFAAGDCRTTMTAVHEEHIARVCPFEFKYLPTYEACSRKDIVLYWENGSTEIYKALNPKCCPMAKYYYYDPLVMLVFASSIAVFTMMIMGWMGVNLSNMEISILDHGANETTIADIVSIASVLAVAVSFAWIAFRKRADPSSLNNYQVVSYLNPIENRIKGLDLVNDRVYQQYSHIKPADYGDCFKYNTQVFPLPKFDPSSPVCNDSCTHRLAITITNGTLHSDLSKMVEHGASGARPVFFRHCSGSESRNFTFVVGRIQDIQSFLQKSKICLLYKDVVPDVLLYHDQVPSASIDTSGLNEEERKLLAKSSNNKSTEADPIKCGSNATEATPTSCEGFCKVRVEVGKMGQPRTVKGRLYYQMGNTTEEKFDIHPQINITAYINDTQIPVNYTLFERGLFVLENLTVGYATSKFASIKIEDPLGRFVKKIVNIRIPPLDQINSTVSVGRIRLISTSEVVCQPSNASCLTNQKSKFGSVIFLPQVRPYPTPLTLTSPKVIVYENHIRTASEDAAGLPLRVASNRITKHGDSYLEIPSLPFGSYTAVVSLDKYKPSTFFFDVYNETVKLQPVVLEPLLVEHDMKVEAVVEDSGVDVDFKILVKGDSGTSCIISQTNKYCGYSMSVSERVDNISRDVVYIKKLAIADYSAYLSLSPPYVQTCQYSADSPAYNSHLVSAVHWEVLEPSKSLQDVKVTIESASRLHTEKNDTSQPTLIEEKPLLDISLQLPVELPDEELKPHRVIALNGSALAADLSLELTTRYGPVLPEPEETKTVSPPTPKTPIPKSPTEPTKVPTEPTKIPTKVPTEIPTEPTEVPTKIPTETKEPTKQPESPETPEVTKKPEETSKTTPPTPVVPKTPEEPTNSSSTQEKSTGPFQLMPPQDIMPDLFNEDYALFSIANIVVPDVIQPSIDDTEFRPQPFTSNFEDWQLDQEFATLVSSFNSKGFNTSMSALDGAFAAEPLTSFENNKTKNDSVSSKTESGSQLTGNRSTTYAKTSNGSMNIMLTENLTETDLHSISYDINSTTVAFRDDQGFYFGNFTVSNSTKAGGNHPEDHGLRNKVFERLANNTTNNMIDIERNFSDSKESTSLKISSKIASSPQNVLNSTLLNGCLNFTEDLKHRNQTNCVEFEASGLNGTADLRRVITFNTPHRMLNLTKTNSFSNSNTNFKNQTSKTVINESHSGNHVTDVEEHHQVDYTNDTLDYKLVREVNFTGANGETSTEKYSNNLKTGSLSKDSFYEASKMVSTSEGTLQLKYNNETHRMENLQKVANESESSSYQKTSPNANATASKFVNITRGPRNSTTDTTSENISTQEKAILTLTVLKPSSSESNGSTLGHVIKNIDVIVNRTQSKSQEIRPDVGGQVIMQNDTKVKVNSYTQVAGTTSNLAFEDSSSDVSTTHLRNDQLAETISNKNHSMTIDIFGKATEVNHTLVSITVCLNLNDCSVIFEENSNTLGPLGSLNSKVVIDSDFNNGTEVSKIRRIEEFSNSTIQKNKITSTNLSKESNESFELLEDVHVETLFEDKENKIVEKISTKQVSVSPKTVKTTSNATISMQITAPNPFTSSSVTNTSQTDNPDGGSITERKTSIKWTPGSKWTPIVSSEVTENEMRKTVPQPGEHTLTQVKLASTNISVFDHSSDSTYRMDVSTANSTLVDGRITNQMKLVTNNLFLANGSLKVEREEVNYSRAPDSDLATLNINETHHWLAVAPKKVDGKVELPKDQELTLVSYNYTVSTINETDGVIKIIKREQYPEDKNEMTKVDFAPKNSSLESGEEESPKVEVSLKNSSQLPDNTTETKEHSTPQNSSKNATTEEVPKTETSAKNITQPVKEEEMTKVETHVMNTTQGGKEESMTKVDFTPKNSSNESSEQEMPKIEVTPINSSKAADEQVMTKIEVPPKNTTKIDDKKDSKSRLLVQNSKSAHLATPTEPTYILIACFTGFGEVSLVKLREMGYSEKVSSHRCGQIIEGRSAEFSVEILRKKSDEAGKT